MHFTKYRGKSLKLFFYSAIIFSIFEYFVSYFLDALFAQKWWDYTNEFFNLNGRISIFYSFVWGIAAILFVNHLYPFFKRKINILISKIPYKIQLYTLNLFAIILLSDVILSVLKHLSFM